MPKFFTRLAAAVALASGLALAPCAPSEAINSGQQYNILVDAPRFTLPKAISGETVSLSEYEGQVRVVTFWASWCPHCRNELSYLIDLQSKYQKDGLQVIAIAADPKEAVQRDAYIKKMGFNFPTLVGDAMTLAQYGEVKSLPTTFIVGRKGYIFKHYIGAPSKAILEADLKRLL
jgi:cytochrome c biogenesis protein CcmG/thiol:disulfide interchange protein DsbE